MIEPTFGHVLPKWTIILLYIKPRNLFSQYSMFTMGNISKIIKTILKKLSLADYMQNSCYKLQTVVYGYKQYVFHLCIIVKHVARCTIVELGRANWLGCHQIDTNPEDHIYTQDNCMGCDILDQRKGTGYQDYSNYANTKVNRDKVNTKWGS